MKKMTATLLFCFFLVLACVSNAQWNLTGNNNATAASILGTTNATPLGLATKNVKRLVIDTLGRIGIGTTTPINILTVKGAGSTPAASWVNAGAPLFVGFGEAAVGNTDFILNMGAAAANARPVFIGRKSRGTLATPGAVANNDYLMSFLSSGYDGSAFQNPAAVEFYVDGTPSAGNVPARISFVTGSNGSDRKERLKISNTGDVVINDTQLVVKKATGYVGIGTLTPGALLDSKGDALINGVTVGRGKGNLLTNTTIGLNALNSNTNGDLNAAFGTYSLQANTTGFGNTAIGYNVLPANTIGTENTGIGYRTLRYITTENNNTALGYKAFANNTGYNNSTALGSNTDISASNQVRLGDNTVTSIGGYANWTNISDGRVKKNVQENVPGLAFINKLRPVTYNLNVSAIDKITHPNKVDDLDEKITAIRKQERVQAKNEKEKIIQSGFIAQDVEKAAKELKYDFSGVDVAKNDKDLYGLRYAEFVVPLVKAVQELSTTNEALKRENAVTKADLQKQIDELKDALMKVIAAKTPCTTDK